ncbi:SemiSWEET family transporter [Candidatus Albibeggiatoa sp. nov. NOAA]|uniref:SemiSWEET family sugar transporter n=1 Tax=Candidatus Albibeggiatoa sp. nov. NOAA TaxID=3162724 RepID=UPI0032F67D0D|nr:SemiSWEET family transporter [Thiotrichaceae bacterium]
MTTDFLGLLVAVVGIYICLPLAYKAYKTQETAEFSFSMLFLFAMPVVLWIVYGVILGAMHLVAVNTVTLFLTFYILRVKLKYGS